mmetsp:Transcript_1212/g.2609  ORF Transcript_1212/g.2609 Transcript_1212/m.2609 type:complete len:302 (+) Transcript_1212:103-1008(+)
MASEGACRECTSVNISHWAPSWPATSIATTYFLSTRLIMYTSMCTRVQQPVYIYFLAGGFLTNSTPFWMLDSSSDCMLARFSASRSFRGPSGSCSSTPFLPSRNRVEKNGTPGNSCDCTYAYSCTLSPLMALRHDSAKRAAAYAMDRVAEPVPALACTTSVPASWMRAIRRLACSRSRDSRGVACERMGRMVMPAWPPTTGTLTSLGSTPSISAMKVSARTTSKVVTPNRREGSYVPAALNTSAAIGTVELTGLEMMATQAWGQWRAIPSHRVRTMPALMLKRSSRVMPGLRGTPAGMTTR